MVNSIKEFILEFFKNSGTEKEGVLTIENAPEGFENFLGEKAPYKLVFDVETHNKIEDSELIDKGSYFLSTVRDYLRDKGQTSLVKLNLEFNPKSLKNKVLEIKREKYNHITEFTVLSVCQYLNDKKQVTNKFLVQDKRILDLDLNEFKLESGKKEDIQILELEIDEQYKIVQNKVKSIMKKETEKIRTNLKEKLNKELERINGYYSKQIKEKDEETERCEEKIHFLQGKLKHTFYKRDKRILEMKIRESKERLEELKQRTYKERLKSEEAFHINDETDKHSLAISSILVNATLIYYPIYKITTFSNGKKKEQTYDPLLRKFL